VRTSQVETVSLFAHFDRLWYTFPVTVFVLIEGVECAQFPAVQRRKSKAVVGGVDRDFVEVVTVENHKIRVVRGAC
jgi:hypothetical protein